jgi:hypothetical protein
MTALFWTPGNLLTTAFIADFSKSVKAKQVANQYYPN